ncbi:MAG: hypothetical protein AABX08_00240 [Nanoarchaeota archaeon]
MKKPKRKKIAIEEKVAGISTSLSGGLSFLGGWQVCHNICLWLIALLAVFGITLVGMPLLFLTKVAIPFWIIAVMLFFITLILYFKKKCISKNLIILNAGIIIAGIPFKEIQSYSSVFRIVGFGLIIIAIFRYIKEKLRNK